MQQWRERILERRPLRIRGAGTKDFYGEEPAGDVLDTRGHAGIVDYEPTELFVTAKCGTPLAQVQAALAEKRQFLAFEPPSFGVATVGGAVAAGLSGPRRAAAGALRDFVLGVKVLDGEGRLLNFGGQVMKNVAGFDVSRLMAGSLGTLGLIVEVTLKVLPLPVAEHTLRFALPAEQALERMNAWAGRSLPVSATCWHDGVLTVRLSGADAAVAAATAALGGDPLAAMPAAAFWDDLREQRHAFFAGPFAAPDEALWRLSLPSMVPTLDLPGPTLIEWGGAQRWRRGGDAAAVRAAAAKAGGHATLFRGNGAVKEAAGAFQPLDPVAARLHREIKRVFDPHGVFNPGRLYPGL